MFMSVGKILDKRIQGVTHDMEFRQTVAKVRRSDSMNNVCDIQIVDGRNIDNVPVKIYGDGMDWFPQVGEWVMVHTGRQMVEIVSRFVGNFGADILPDMALNEDKFSDFVGGPVASTCTGV